MNFPVTASKTNGTERKCGKDTSLFHQPKYRPGDTLKVKAWITDYKNEPWNKPVDLKASGFRRVESSQTHPRAPLAPGVFTWQMVWAIRWK